MSRIVFGINPVREAIRSSPDEVERVFYCEHPKGEAQRLVNDAKKCHIKTSREEKKYLDKLTGEPKHQGVAALISDFSYSDLHDILDVCKGSDDAAFILVLDGIQDPHNLGAIARSAEAAGAHGIIIPKDRAVGVTSTVEKVACGATQHIKIARVTNIARTLEEIKEAGIWVAGLDGSGDTSLYSADLKLDTALVVGSEGKGIRPLVRKKCDFLINIPMRGKINSLNASVSAGVAMYELQRQRSSTDISS
ncbi:MAG: 23S rRNA (guanosine(2251)-2'-O)-methyltransferase RlmB [Proteobacteria bacterium]|nr:23S rRNA (guanosine(2251)-2'-O)-methyltransferase RlmB [Pseudomonadota bacterium]